MVAPQDKEGLGHSTDVFGVQSYMVPANAGFFAKDLVPTLACWLDLHIADRQKVNLVVSRRSPGLNIRSVLYVLPKALMPRNFHS